MQVGSDNWLVTNLGKLNWYIYYKQAEVSTPDGYEVDLDGTLKSDKNETSFWFNPEDESNPVKSFYITGNAQRASELVESVHSSFISFYGPESVSEVQIGPVGGIVGQYFSTYSENEVYDEEADDIDETASEDMIPEETSAEPSEDAEDSETAANEPAGDSGTPSDEGAEQTEDEETIADSLKDDEADAPASEERSSPEGATPPEEGAEATEDEEALPEPRIERTMQLVAYFPAQRNSSIVFVMNVRVEEDAERPTLDELLEMAAPLAGCIDIYVPNAKP